MRQLNRFCACPNAGTATVAVTGKGRYYGEASGTFGIEKAANPVGKLSGKRAKVTASRWGSVKVKPSKAFKGLGRAKGKLRFKKLKGAKRIVVNRRTGRLSVKAGTKAGTYKLKVRVKARGNANYRPGKKTVTVKVRVKSPRTTRVADGWYSVSLQASNMTFTQTGFRTGSELSYNTSLRSLIGNRKTIGAKTRTFKLANTVRWCGSDWRDSEFRVASRSEMLANLRNAKASYPHAGITFEVKGGKVVEIRFGG